MYPFLLDKIFPLAKSFRETSPNFFHDMSFTIHYGYLYGPVNIFMTRPPAQRYGCVYIWTRTHFGGKRKYPLTQFPPASVSVYSATSLSF